MELKYFETHLTEHCNLNCQSCDNFSPLAKKSFTSLETLEKDFERISNLAEDKIELIRLLGGEPLLHPEVDECLKIARKHFSKSEIRMTTNGILLLTQPDEFWETCRDNNITIEITFYPIDIKSEAVEKVANYFDVKVIPFGNVQKPEKFSYRNPINTKCDQDIQSNFEKCYQVGNCISLKEGKLYPCSCIPNICHFNEYFGKDVKVTEKDYIDIYNSSLEEIETFLDTPVPFCGYCNVNNRTRGKKWAVTKREIGEWLDD